MSTFDDSIILWRKLVHVHHCCSLEICDGRCCQQNNFIESSIVAAIVAVRVITAIIYLLVILAVATLLLLPDLLCCCHWFFVGPLDDSGGYAQTMTLMEQQPGTRRCSPFQCHGPLPSIVVRSSSTGTTSHLWSGTTNPHQRSNKRCIAYTKS